MTDDPAPADAVVIERTFDAPVELIWQLWTDPAHFAAWYGPAGATVPVAKMDVRVGGARLICMEAPTPDGPRQMWFAGEYLEVDEPRRLAYTESISDAEGNVRAPDGHPEGHPGTTEVHVELTALGTGGTRMVLTHHGVPADSPGAVGWAMALDELAARAAAL
jgi:uncharacterized protein YndB with AHSA1/START domain